MQLFDIKGC